MAKIEDLTGKTFGRLLVIHRAENSKCGRAQWKTKCSCGNIQTTLACHLKSGHTISCKCASSEATIERNRTHDLSHIPEYSNWRAMHRRCIDTSHPSYKDYGGRGIAVCKEWEQIENFIQDMGSKPTPKHTIERIKNEFGYSKDNCIWATTKAQSRNKRNNRLINHEGQLLIIADIAEKIGMDKEALRGRLRLGWNLQDAVSRPMNQPCNQLSYVFNGIRKKLIDIAKETGVPYSTLHYRLSKGMTINEAVKNIKEAMA
ncbi:MAG: hypothetical protein WC373_09580 [Smithella sp.]|jgi:hypothetical protein